jgi:hypothetical protein
MKIKLVNLIEGGVNTPAPATGTSAAKPSTPKQADLSSWDLLKGIAGGAIGFATGSPSAGVKMASSAATTDTKDLVPNAVKNTSSVGAVIGGGLGLLVGGLPGAVAGAAIGSQIPGAVSGNASSDTAPNTASKAKPANQEHVDRHKDYMERTQRKLERDRLTRQAEVEAESHKDRMARIGRSKTRIFEQQNLQFKSGALTSLLQEDGVIDTVSNFITGTWDTAKKQASKSVPYFTTGAINPKVAAKEFVNLTTPSPEDPSSVKFVKSLVGHSPRTFAALQAGRAATAAAFTPANAAEKVEHYANVLRATNPINLGAAVSRAIGNAAQYELRNRLFYGLGSGTGALKSKGLGTLATAAGVLGGIGNVTTPYTDAMAKGAGKVIGAMKDDWRIAAMP